MFLLVNQFILFCSNPIQFLWRYLSFFVVLRNIYVCIVSGKNHGHVNRWTKNFGGWRGRKCRDVTRKILGRLGEASQSRLLRRSVSDFHSRPHCQLLGSRLAVEFIMSIFRDRQLAFISRSPSFLRANFFSFAPRREILLLWTFFRRRGSLSSAISENPHSYPDIIQLLTQISEFYPFSNFYEHNWKKIEQYGMHFFAIFHRCIKIRNLLIKYWIIYYFENSVSFFYFKISESLHCSCNEIST